jgi:hypothetical protein
VRPGFEGGQIPLVRRAPRLRGFKNPTRVEFLAVNLDTIADRFPAGSTVDASRASTSACSIEDVNQPFKVLCRGELPHALTVTGAAAVGGREGGDHRGRRFVRGAGSGRPHAAQPVHRRKAGTGGCTTSRWPPRRTRTSRPGGLTGHGH